MALRIDPFDPLTTRETSEGDALSVRAVQSMTNGVNVLRQHMPSMLLNRLYMTSETTGVGTSTSTGVELLGAFPLVGYRNIHVVGQFKKLSGVDAYWDFYAVPAHIMDLTNWATAYTDTSNDWARGSILVSSASLTTGKCTLDMTGLNTKSVVLFCRLRSATPSSATSSDVWSLTIWEGGCDE